VTGGAEGDPPNKSKLASTTDLIARALAKLWLSCPFSLSRYNYSLDKKKKDEKKSSRKGEGKRKRKLRRVQVSNSVGKEKLSTLLNRASITVNAQKKRPIIKSRLRLISRQAK